MDRHPTVPVLFTVKLELCGFAEKKRKKKHAQLKSGIGA